MRGYWGLVFAVGLVVSGFSTCAYAQTEHDHEHGGHERHDSSTGHGMDHPMGHDSTMSGHADHGGMSAMRHAAGSEESPDYIRVDAATGYSVVLGRKNPVPELAPEWIDDGEGGRIKLFRMTVEDVHFEIFPGKTLMGWGFNGSVPGPTIRVRQGETIRIELTNKTDTGHTLHVHGQPKNVADDGVPYLGQKPVQQNESYTYEITAVNPGTNWYHCHVDGAHHVDMGMYGAFIVEPKDQPVVYDREYTMILDEWPTAHKHIHKGAMPMEGHEEHGVVTEHPGVPRHRHLGEAPKKRDWYPETYDAYQPIYDGFSINGRSFPYTEPVDVRTGERVLIRFINVGYQPHFMHTHAHRFRVVARDGSPVDEPQRIDTVEVGPGQRVDILLVADNPGIWPFHCHRLDHVNNEHIYPGGMLTFIRYLDYDPETEGK